MFLRVVETIVTQEKTVNEEFDNETKLEGITIPDLEQQELFDVHGQPLYGKAG
jgi:hypothetical protein